MIRRTAILKDEIERALDKHIQYNKSLFRLSGSEEDRARYYESQDCYGIVMSILEEEG